MKKTLFFVALSLTACGKEKDNDRSTREPTQKPAPLALLQNISEASFWDYSVENRCDGLKEYLTSFAKQRLDGSVSNFNCFESAPGSESYVVAAELAFGQEKAPLAISINKTGARVSLCKGDYKSDPTELNCPTDLAVAPDTKLALTKKDLPVLLAAWTAVPQTKQLIYGLKPDDFYQKAFAQLSSPTGVSVPFEGKEYRFFFKLTASDDSASKGQVAIEKIEPAEGLLIFGCEDSACLDQKTFDYQIRNQWFTFASSGKLSAFIIPKPD